MEENFYQNTFKLVCTAVFSLLIFSVVKANEKNITAGYHYTAAQEDGCSPVSTLPCSNITVQLPLNLSFNNPVAGTIADKNGQGTGFTTINTYSGTRLTADGQPTVTQVPGYEPSKLTLTGGRLQLVANKGIDYQANNNQINILGVQLSP